MSRYLLNTVTFDDDGTVTIQYLDKQDALRCDGGLFTSKCVSVTPTATALHQSLIDARDEILDILGDIETAYRDTPAFVPGEDDSEEDDLELGMGF